MKLILILILVVANSTASVFTIKNEQVEFQQSSFLISDLVKEFAKLEKMNLVFDSEFRDSRIISVGPKNLGKDSLGLYISAMLSQGGFGMRTLPETGTLSVFNSRDFKYLSTSLYSDISKVPETYEMVQFNYKLKHLKSVKLTKYLRPFMGRYGRIIDHSNRVLISDSGKNIRRLMKIIQEIDNPEYLKSETEVKELNEKNKKIVEKGGGFIEVFNNNNFIFLLLFLLVGGVIGFGLRGYAMKRIEGGW